MESCGSLRTHTCQVGMFAFAPAVAIAGSAASVISANQHASQHRNVLQRSYQSDNDDDDDDDAANDDKENGMLTISSNPSTVTMTMITTISNQHVAAVEKLSLNRRG